MDHASGKKQKVDILLAETTSAGMSVQSLQISLYREYPGMKVLFMSGTFDARFSQILGRQVERLFLLKPFTREALLEKIHDCLR
jgi:FixJ family two-component response regulator